MAGLNERLIDENAKYFEGEAVVNGTASSGYIRTGTGGQLGGTKILVRVNDAVTLADTKVITARVNEADDDQGTSAQELGSFTLTASGATTYANGYHLWEFVLPRTTSKEFTNVDIISDDATVSGTVDVFCSSPVGFTNV